MSEEEAEQQQPPELVEEEHPEGEPQVGQQHPQRQRHPPQMLTYDALGQPKVTTRGINIKQMDVKKPNPCVQMFWRLWVQHKDNKTASLHMHSYIRASLHMHTHIRTSLHMHTYIRASIQSHTSLPPHHMLIHNIARTQDFHCNCS